MNYQITKQDIDVLRQGNMQIYLKAELLNSKFKILDSIEGKIISDNFSQDSESVQRRSYSCDIVVTDASFSLGKDKKIWLDKRIRIYYGVWSLREKKIIWYPLGIYAYVSAKYSFSATERKLSLSCADLMSLYDGTLNGQMGGYGSSNSDSSHVNQGLKIPAGEDIRQSVIATLKDAHIEKYVVEDIKKEIPYDLEFNTGVTYQEVWKTIAELYDSWEYFFDVDGTFIWRQIPTCADDDIILNDNIMKTLVIDENQDFDFSGIYNVTEVWGKVLELENDDRYADSSTYSDNTYDISLEYFTSWEDVDNLTMIGFKVCAENLEAPYLTINSWADKIPIYDGNGNSLESGKLKADTVYVFRIRRLGVSGDENPDTDDNQLIVAAYLLGQFQCYGKYVSNNETDPDNPFNVDNLGYEIMQSVDYDGLSDDAACYNQAEYLTYFSTAMQDTITLNMIVVPWLEVNQKIEYTPLNSKQKAQYIVKSMNWSTGSGTMTLTLYKFVESFSYVYKSKHNS